MEEIRYVKRDNFKQFAALLLILLILYFTLGPTTVFPTIFLGKGEGKHGNLELVFEPNTLGRDAPSTIVFTLTIKNPTGSNETLATGITRFFVKVYGLDGRLIGVSGGERTLVLYLFTIKSHESLVFDYTWSYYFGDYFRHPLVLLPGVYRLTALLNSSGSVETTNVLMIILP